MNELRLNLRIAVNNDGSARVLGQTRDDINGISTASGNASRGLRTMDSAASSLMRTLAPLVGIYELISFGDWIVKDTATVQDLDTRLHALTATADDYSKTVAYINTVAEDQHKKLNDLSDSYAKLRVLQNSGIITGQQTKGLFEGLNNAASNLGAGNDQLKQSFFGLAQGLASGTLHAEELNQVTEPMPGLMNSLDKALGQGAGGMRRLTNDGKVTSQMFAENLVKALHDFDGAAAATAQNINAKSTDINYSWTRLIKSFEPSTTAIFTPLQDGVKDVLDSTRQFNEAAMTVGETNVTASSLAQGAWAVTTSAISDDWDTLKAAGLGAAADTVSGWIASGDQMESNVKFVVNDMIGLFVGLGHSVGIIFGSLAINVSNTLDNAIAKASAAAGDVARMGVGDFSFSSSKAVVDKPLVNGWADAAAQLKIDLSTDYIGTFTEAVKGASVAYQGLADEQKKAAAEAEQAKAKNLQLAASHNAVGSSVGQLTAEQKKAATAEKSRHEDVLKTIAALQNELEVNRLNDKEKSLQAELYGKLLKAKGDERDIITSLVTQIHAEADAREAQKKGIDAGASALESEIDRYQKLTQSVNEYKYSQLLLAGVSPGNAVEIVAQSSVNDGIEKQQQKITDARTSLENYNKSLADTIAKTSDLGATNSAIFDGALGGLNTMSGAFDNMVKSITANTKALDELHKQQIANTNFEKTAITDINKARDPAQYLADLKIIADNKKIYALEERALNIENLKDSLTGIRQSASAMGSMFAENTAARKAFNIVSLAASVSERLADMAQLEVKAALAVLTQGQGDPYTAFARIAAMGAIVASILSAANAGTFRFGGNASSPGPQGMAPDTGTVLGDSTAKSQSIDKTYQLLKDIQAENYPVLKSIDKGIADLHSGITDVITRLYQAGGLAGVNAPASQVTGLASILNPVTLVGAISPVLAKFADPVTTFLLNGIFGGKQESVVNSQGIATGATSVADILAGKNLQASQFAQIETKTSGGWFGSDSFSTVNQYSELDAKTQKALNDVFKSMSATMLGLADGLGMGLSDRVKNYVIPGFMVDLKGLNGEDAAKKLNGVLSTALDTMSTSVFGDILGQYQKLGEGMLETAVRIVSEVAVVKDAVGRSGLTLTGDAIAISDALAQAAGGITEFQKSFDNFYTHFYSAAEQQTQLTAQLSSQLNDVNMALPATRDGYKNLISALDLNNAADQDRYTLLLKLSSAADTYYKNIEQLTQNRRALEISYYSASGRAVDALNTQRADEIAALKLTGDAIAVNYQQMIYAAQDLASAQKAAADAANSGLDAAMKKLTASVDAQKTVLSDKYKADSDALKAQLDATLKANATQKQSASDLLNSLTSTAQKIRSALSSTVVDTAELTRQRRLSAQSVLQSALDLAKSGGSLANYAGLDQALTDIAKPSQDLFATFQDFQRDQGRTAAVISDLADHADTQVSVAQLTLNAIDSAATAAQAQYDAQYKVLTDTYNAETSQFDGILSSAQTQIDLLRGIDNSILTLAQALLGVDAAKAVAAQTTASVAPTFAFKVNEGATAGGYQSSGGAFYDASNGLINSKTGGIYTIAAAQQWVKDTLAAGNPALVRATAIAEGISAQSLDVLMGDSPGTWNAWAEANKLPAFAAGGDHSGGLRLVGENGPEIEATGPSRIFNAQQTRDILSGNDNNAALIAVVEKLTATVAKLEARLEQIEKNTRDTEKNTKESSTVLGKVTLGGTSVRTTPA